MKVESFEIFVSYYQFGVYDAAMDRPFNDWSAQHVAQGFSWRPESAFFQSPFEDGPHFFQVQLSDDRPLPDKRSQRAIVVPFPRIITREVEIGSIGSSHTFAMPAARNSIFAEFIARRKETPLVKLTFYNESRALFRIVRAESSDMATATLLTTAQPV
jgi:hypothetical protein